MIVHRGWLQNKHVETVHYRWVCGTNDEGDGEGSDHRSILDCSNMMTVFCVSCAKRACFVKAFYRPFVGCDCSPRLVAKQTCRNSALSLGIWEESLSMMIGRAGGWMEWSGAVKGRAGDGDGDGEGEGGRGEDNRSILYCSNMMTVLCVSWAKQSCFVKAYYRPFVSCDRSILDCSNMMTVLCVSCAKQSCFVKEYYSPFVSCDRSIFECNNMKTVLCVS